MDLTEREAEERERMEKLKSVLIYFQLESCFWNEQVDFLGFFFFGWLEVWEGGRRHCF